jgi:hypothetical protein
MDAAGKSPGSAPVLMCADLDDVEANGSRAVREFHVYRDMLVENPETKFDGQWWAPLSARCELALSFEAIDTRGWKVR